MPAAARSAADTLLPTLSCQRRASNWRAHRRGALWFRVYQTIAPAPLTLSCQVINMDTSAFAAIVGRWSIANLKCRDSVALFLYQWVRSMTLTRSAICERKNGTESLLRVLVWSSFLTIPSVPFTSGNYRGQQTKLDKFNGYRNQILHQSFICCWSCLKLSVVTRSKTAQRTYWSILVDYSWSIQNDTEYAVSFELKVSNTLESLGLFIESDHSCVTRHSQPQVIANCILDQVNIDVLHCVTYVFYSQMEYCDTR